MCSWFCSWSCSCSTRQGNCLRDEQRPTIWVGVHDGSFDRNDRGAPISSALEALAEIRNNDPIIADFAAAPGGVLDGVVGGATICPRPFREDTRPRHWFARHIIQSMTSADKGSQHNRLLLNWRMKKRTRVRGRWGTGPRCSHRTVNGPQPVIATDLIENKT